MIGRDQFVEGRRAKDDLLAVSGPQPWASRGGWSLGWRDLASRIGRPLEERGLFEARRLGIVWFFHEQIITVVLSIESLLWEKTEIVSQSLSQVVAERKDCGSWAGLQKLTSRRAAPIDLYPSSGRLPSRHAEAQADELVFWLALDAGCRPEAARAEVPATAANHPERGE
jgi:hypothetical protein